MSRIDNDDRTITSIKINITLKQLMAVAVLAAAVSGAVLFIGGCGSPTNPQENVIQAPSRLTLVEQVNTAIGQPNYVIYHDATSGCDIVVFSATYGSVVLPPKPQ